jgi:hypothetical protein
MTRIVKLYLVWLDYCSILYKWADDYLSINKNLINKSESRIMINKNIFFNYKKSYCYVKYHYYSVIK